MSFTITITRSFSQAGQDPVSYQKSFTQGGMVPVSESIPDGSTDLRVTLPINLDSLKTLFIGSNQDVTIETNHPGGSSSAPDQTFDVKANSPIDWTEDDPEDCPLTTDVTEIYVTNNSGAPAQLEIRALVDATPD